MDYVFPYHLGPRKDGARLVTFPDVPEAATEWRKGEDQAALALDCLIAALGGYIELRRDLPRPSRPRRGQKAVAVPPLVAAKLALYQSMSERKLTRVALAARLGLTEGAVRKLLDLDHRSHIGQITRALRLLGRELVVSVRDAA